MFLQLFYFFMRKNVRQQRRDICAHTNYSTHLAGTDYCLNVRRRLRTQHVYCVRVRVLLNATDCELKLYMRARATLVYGLFLLFINCFFYLFTDVHYNVQINYSFLNTCSCALRRETLWQHLKPRKSSKLVNPRI